MASLWDNTWTHFSCRLYKRIANQCALLFEPVRILGCNLVSHQYRFSFHEICFSQVTFQFMYAVSWWINAQLEMWANAQRDGRPAKYRWCPLFNDAKFGWHPLLECRPVTLPRRQTRWNLQGCPNLPKRSQPLVGRSSPYYGDSPAVKPPILGDACIRVRIKYFYSFMTFRPY